MKREKYLIVTFFETTMALYMERICRQDAKDGRIIPLPREIDAGCGLVWATKDMDQENWRVWLQSRGVRYERMLEAVI